MDLAKLEYILEATLFVSGDGVSLEYIAEKLELQKSEINNALESLRKRYGGKRGIHLVQFDGKVQFSTNPDYADPVAAVLNPIREKELSRAALETVAIIAYKQPITKLEIEEVRGVNSDYAVSMLLEHKLIYVAGRKDAIGKPYLFGTTDEFLKRFQIAGLEELPGYDELLSKIEIIYKPSGDALFHRFDIPDDSAGESGASMPDIPVEIESAGQNNGGVSDAFLPDDFKDADTADTVIAQMLAEAAAHKDGGVVKDAFLSGTSAGTTDEEFPDFLQGEEGLVKI